MRCKRAFHAGFRLAVFPFIVLVALASRVGAQTVTAGEFVLPHTLGADARVAITKILDSARALDLPVDPLLDRAAEGALKGADDQRIVLAVRTLARELAEARAFIVAEGKAAGSLRTTPVLNALAGALHAGIAPANLRQLVRTAAKRAPNDAEINDVFVVALVTMVDLVAKRVAPTTATSSIDQLLGHRASAAQFAVLRSEVERDIRSGHSPESALQARAQAQLRTIPSSPTRSAPAAPAVPRRPPGEH